MDYRYDKVNQKIWFPYYVSNKKIDYICPTGVHNRCPDGGCNEDCQKQNPNYWKNILNLEIPKHPQIGCYGCSNTAGPNLRLDQTWPGHLSKMTGNIIGNFSSSAGGIDSIFYNLRTSFHDYGIKYAIILLPNFARRLLVLERNGFYLRYPVSVGTEWIFDHPIATAWTTKNEMTNLINEVKKTLVNDVYNTHSKDQLEDLVTFCKDNSIIFKLSSWDTTVYDHIIKNFTSYSLPFFDFKWPFQMMKDGVHPGPDFHYHWAELIKDQISY
jgi:hypothetical protein